MSLDYSNCTQCPRSCGANRTVSRPEADGAASRAGVCGESDTIRAAVACLHFGEEPPITVWGGSGTIFITGCNLRCAFCQNYQISQYGMGAPLSPEAFADLCLRLEAAHAENINIVTGSHHIPAIARALTLAKERGLTLPVCWNSSAYESVEALELLRGLVDIWLPDLKTLNPRIAQSVFKAQDYPAVAKRAIRWMLENTEARFVEVAAPRGENAGVPDKAGSALAAGGAAPSGNEAGAARADNACAEQPGTSRAGTASADTGVTKEKMLSGVIIRHLVLPGRMDDTRLVLDWLKRNADRADNHAACISLMSQYTPVAIDAQKLADNCRLAGGRAPAPEALQTSLNQREAALSAFNNRLLNRAEFAQIQELIQSYDFQYLFYQELEEDTEWLPDFTRPQPFSNALARPLWWWKEAQTL